jgi:hypothetical protein
LHVHRQLDLADDLLVDDERGYVRPRLVEHGVVDGVDLRRQVEHPSHPPVLGSPPPDHPARGPEQPDLFLDDPHADLPGAEHHER